MSNRSPFRLVRRSLYVCRSCRRHALPGEPSASPAPPASKRWISQSYIRKIQDAEAEWQLRAQNIKEGKSKSMLQTLEERGYVNQIVGSRDDLDSLLTNRRVGVYVGVDPTAASMHVGHMVPFMALGWMYVHGYAANFLLGGFTSHIGDPTGRLTGRAALTNPERTANVAAMHLQLKRFGASLEDYAARKGYMKEWAWKRALLNNSNWMHNLPVAKFLSSMGANMRLGPLLGRDTVKNRMEKGDGMSFAEFTYPLIQAWDWWHLFQQGTQVQIGGADQYGNIMAGAQAIKQMAPHDHEYQLKLRQAKIVDRKNGVTGATDDPIGFTVPLLTTASGEKFGKSAGNAVWLDETMTSCFDLYQFFLRSADADVEKYLRLLTFVPLNEIEAIMQEHEKDQSKRVAQHKLAKEFVELVHGHEKAAQAEKEHRQMFSKNLSIGDIKASVAEARAGEPVGDAKSSFINPSMNKHAAPATKESNTEVHIVLPRRLVFDQPLSRILWSSGMVATRAEGQRLISAGGAYVGAQSNGGGALTDTLSFAPAQTPEWTHVRQFVIDEKLLILRVGKWKMKIIKIIPDEEYDKTGLTCPGWQTKSLNETGMNTV